ncbi:MAG: malto-oligosyltrehalose trehalohydrolase [Candidatus Dormibacteria bacterium]
MSEGIWVWAPAATRVELVAGGGRFEMTVEASGWFSAPTATVADNAGYMLAIDGGEPRPDPRSAHQPEGVHGPSHLVNHAAFRWGDAAWSGLPLADAVIYELHVGTFTPEGSFDAAAARLPYLLELGINAVELMPVATFPGARGWGYDGVDIFAPHPAYGGPDGLKRLVDACHAAGIAVVMDVVYNHLGPDGNYLAEFGPYFTDVYQTPWGRALNFDGAGSDEVRRFFIDNAVMWLRDYHCDGLRLDAVHAIIDTSAVHFLEEVTAAVDALGAELGRELWMIAESDLNDPRVVASRDRGGYGFDAQWSDDFHHALHAALTGEHAGYYAGFDGLEDVATALRQAFVFDGRYSPYRGRKFGRRPVGIPGTSFLGYIQDHDQVGNRAQGERISQLVSPGLCRVAAALVLTSPFTPMIFAGEEWAATTPFLYFTDHQSADLARAVTAGRRAEFAGFGWPAGAVPDPQSPQTFEASRLDWTELESEPHRGTFQWYRDLVHLRRAEPALRNGRMGDVVVRHGPSWIEMVREDIAVYCNLGGERVSFGSGGTLLLASEKGTRTDGEGTELPPESAAVVRLG